MKVAVVVDNELDHDVRVQKEIKLYEHLGYDVSVLCFGFKGETYTNHKIPVTRVEISLKLKNTFYFFNLIFPFYRRLWARAVCNFLKNEEFDIVHTHDLYMALPVKKGIKKSGKSIPLVLDLHENYPIAYASYSWVNKSAFRKFLTRPEKWKKLEKSYLEAADGIIVLSDSFKDELCSKYPGLKSRKWFTLPNVQDLDSFGEPTEATIENNEQIVFLYFGVLGVRRGVFDVMDAFIDLQQRRQDIKLLLIGPLDKADRNLFEEKAKKLNETVFEYIPWVPQNELLNYTQISHVGLCPLHVNPQHESGVANKIFQYMYAGLPLLVSNCRPQMKIVQENHIGMVFSNQAELLSSIEAFADKKKEEVHAWGEKAHDVLINKYALDSFKDGLHSFYQDMQK